MTIAALTIADRKVLRLERIKETYRSLIHVSDGFFKCMLLINGAALAGVLFYLASPGAAIQPFLVRQLMSSAHLFILGIIFCGLALFFSCFAQVHMFNEDMTGEKAVPPHTLLGVPAGLCMLSLVVFSAGMWFSTDTFSFPRDKGAIVATHDAYRGVDKEITPVAEIGDAALRCGTDARRLYSSTVMGKPVDESFTPDDVNAIRRYERRCMNLAGYTMDSSMRSCAAQFLPEEDPLCYRPRREWRYKNGYGT